VSIVLYIPEVLQIQESQAIIVCLRSVMISIEMSRLSTMELTEDVSNAQLDKWLAPLIHLESPPHVLLFPLELQ